MQELKAFNEKRAEIYWWFSSLFAKELTQADLEQYQSPEIRSFLSGLGENPSLKPAIDRVVDALNRQLDREDDQLELAADFCDLFLKSDKESALPYASMYIGTTGLLHDKPANEMEALLQKYGVAVEQGLNEPADHIAIELDLLGNIIIRSNELEQERHFEESFAEQEAFIRQHVLSWVAKFATKCQGLDNFGFYSAVAALLVAFLELDCQYLTGE
ncbi:chaperone protein TorD [Vibrio ichthyoenteri ATCC 700023]|uniref:Chaperone protein TorD n=1 Tax=Vibrio ichthyoenteri ATCC 700023 TaxID=870968 RepID=F9S3A9_9VIBR|nr:molecular chaperone TorD [Vibrio ichthyoenteri]EGU38133.1 chaperone protein TorD [Vibrio ichthyoenteri ATCC 700023]